MSLPAKDFYGLSGKAVPDRSECSISNNLDDEANQLWDCQLPDDITPDFKVIEQDEQASRQLSLSGLSLNDDFEASEFSPSGFSQFSSSQQLISPRRSDGLITSQKKGFPGSSYCENHPTAAFLPLATSNWDQQLASVDFHFKNGKDEYHYNGDYNGGFLDSSATENAVVEDAVVDPLEYLVSHFPGFSAESLADVYNANGCDLNMTIEMLTQLEMQVDGSLNQSANSKASTAPSFSMLDFPALPTAEDQNGLSKYSLEDSQGATSGYRSSSIFGSNIDFVSTVRKLASQNSGSWKLEKKGADDENVGSSRGSRVLTKQYDVNSKLGFGNKLQSIGTTRATPPWLETGDAVANLYSESREEARDFACLRNAFFEQARQAYLIGNKALAKELSVKGRLYNMHMKAAHEKAQESIYRQRNPVGSQLQGYGQGQDRLIDLHGLHISEALHILKHELSILKSTARSSGHRLQVMICVGTGHHTKGARTPARLPIAVEQFLLEEGLHFTQPQPGLLRVVIY
uniref:Smr domain-containing protein n=1 Tax=Ananas comosus var. bracteatus TaxID=296719 RepID=A0A6V7P5J5_ANACO|nr:unnamed protein product [Ananas comosus var. bracteatus]